mgnify:CR=1 FL=1
MLKFTAEHEWLKIEDGIATVGITTHAAGQLGDLLHDVALQADSGVHGCRGERDHDDRGEDDVKHQEHHDGDRGKAGKAGGRECALSHAAIPGWRPARRTAGQS